jgi:putative Mg2+ transporter-C (MgtC) family protein
MNITIGWSEITLRLTLTVLAGLIIGINRGEHGRPAGMRTTLLVCLAASLSMLQANLLMNSVGKSHDSFVVLDLMRLPLGVLSGMGFIGAGTILRRGSLVLGITTAATLWFVTLMGLCFGGGQIGLGLAALGLGCFTLWILKCVEGWMEQDARGTLHVITLGSTPTDAELRLQITQDRCTILSWSVTYCRNPEKREISCDIRWQTRMGTAWPPAVVDRLRSNPAIAMLSWQPQGDSGSGEAQQTMPQGTPVPISAPSSD